MILKDYLNRTSLLGRYFFIPLDMLSYHNSLFVDFYSTRTLKFFFEDISEENDRFRLLDRRERGI